MAINFDALPQDKPAGNLLDKGFYRAVIEKAEMKTPKSGGNQYLAVTFNLFDREGKAKGKLWDNFFDVDKELPRYKIARLLTALGLQLSGSFELRDLTKIIVNKQLLVDVSVDEKNTPPRNQVEVFKNEIYYPVAQWAALTGVVTDSELPFTFDAEDSEDSVPAPTDADAPAPAADGDGDDY